MGGKIPDVSTSLFVDHGEKDGVKETLPIFNTDHHEKHAGCVQVCLHSITSSLATECTDHLQCCCRHRALVAF